APTTGSPDPSLTVPAILPQLLGGCICIATSTGLTSYGVSVATSNPARYSPGCDTAPASTVTRTVTASPGATSNSVRSARNHGTAETAWPHWSYPGSVSPNGTELKGPVEPPTL